MEEEICPGGAHSDHLLGLEDLVEHDTVQLLDLSVNISHDERQVLVSLAQKLHFADR